MTNGSGTASVDIVNSQTCGGGNFYVSGFDGVLIDNNVFDGQGLALNGVTDGSRDRQHIPEHLTTPSGPTTADFVPD